VVVLYNGIIVTDGVTTQWCQ